MSNKMKIFFSTVLLAAVVAICSVFANAGSDEGSNDRLSDGESTGQSLLDVKGALGEEELQGGV